MKPRNTPLSQSFSQSFAHSRSLRWLAVVVAALLLLVFASATRASTWVDPRIWPATCQI